MFYIYLLLQGTFILFILGEAIIQLVQNPGTLDAKDIIRGLMGFAVVFNIGDIYHQQQLVEKHEFKVNHKVAPINLWITGHAVLSMCILFFAAGVKLVYDDEDTARERRRKEEFIMCVFASISLNIIYLLRMQYKGICHGDSLRYGAYGVRIGLSTLIAFIPNMTTDATESVGILFAITFFLVIQVTRCR
jgi:low temperature requirement protein LtrA